MRESSGWTRVCPRYKDMGAPESEQAAAIRRQRFSGMGIRLFCLLALWAVTGAEAGTAATEAGGVGAWMQGGLSRSAAQGSALVASSRVSTAEAEWHNALRPLGRGVDLCLARNGQALYDILLPAAPSTQEQVAAGELAHWLGEMTQAPFVVRREGDTEADGHVISVGDTHRSRRADLATGIAELGPEGYLLTVDNGDLLLRGGSARGPLTAVFAFLEEDLGCRWYTASSVHIPSSATLTVQVVPRTYSPPFALRDPFSFVSNDSQWSLRNRTNAYHAVLAAEVGGNLNYAPGWFVHTYNHILASTDENLRACPECFMLDADGTRSKRQLCPTHPRVVERAIAQVRAVLAAHPDAELVSVSQNDIRGYCHCDRCQALMQREGTPAAPLLYLVNAVAEAVAAAYPDVTITTLGYQDTVPATRDLRPAANVAIRLATDVMWADPFAPAATSSIFMGALCGWERVAERIHIWDYQVNFGDYFQPWPSFHAKAENLRLFAQHHVTGVMIQGAYQAPGNERQEMRAWVFAKLLWDPSRPLWPLMQDFVRGYYGPAAQPLENYNRMLYDCGRQHQGVSDCMGVPAFVACSDSLFDEAERLALAAHDGEVLERVKLARLPVMDLALPLALGRWVASQSEMDRRAYTQMLNRFVAVAQRAGVRKYSEGLSLDAWMARRRGFVSPPSGPEQRTARVGDAEIHLYRLPAAWRLRRDPRAEGEAQRWFAGDVDDKEWGAYRTDLGVGWEEQGFPGTDGLFWFRTQVAVPEAMQGRYMYLYFGACDEEAWVWVNGQLLGERTAASTGTDLTVLWLQPFALEVPDSLNSGRQWRLAVRVSDAGGMGGLYMPVYVVSADVPLSTTEITEAVGERNPYGE